MHQHIFLAASVNSPDLGSLISQVLDSTLNSLSHWLHHSCLAASPMAKIHNSAKSSTWYQDSSWMKGWLLKFTLGNQSRLLVHSRPKPFKCIAVSTHGEKHSREEIKDLPHQHIKVIQLWLWYGMCVFVRLCVHVYSLRIWACKASWF